MMSEEQKSCGHGFFATYQVSEKLVTLSFINEIDLTCLYSINIKKHLPLIMSAYLCLGSLR